MTKTKNSSKETRTAVFCDYPKFSQIPVALAKDRSVSDIAYRLYGVYHSYSQEKSLVQKPITFVSQKTLARDMNRAVETISRKTTELIKSGWIIVIHRGWRSNYIFLNGKPKRRQRKILSPRDKMLLKERAKLQAEKQRQKHIPRQSLTAQSNLNLTVESNK